MNNNLDYFRRRAAEEAAIARRSTDRLAASIHQILATEYLRRVAELGKPAEMRQFASSL